MKEVESYRKDDRKKENLQIKIKNIEMIFESYINMNLIIISKFVKIVPFLAILYFYNFQSYDETYNLLFLYFFVG